MTGILPYSSSSLPSLSLHLAFFPSSLLFSSLFFILSTFYVYVVIRYILPMSLCLYLPIHLFIYVPSEIISLSHKFFLIWPLAIIVHFLLMVSAACIKVSVRFSSLSGNRCDQNYSLIRRWTAYNVSCSILRICSLGWDMKEWSKKLQIFQLWSANNHFMLMVSNSRSIYTFIHLHYSISFTPFLNSYWIYSVLGHPNCLNWRPVNIGI